MIIFDLLDSCKRVPYWLYSYFVLGCTHTSLSSLPLEQRSGQYTRTCMNCGTQVSTPFAIKTIKYPNRRAAKLERLIEKLKPSKSKGAIPIRSKKKVG